MYLQDTADYGAIGKHVKVILVPLPGGPTGWCTFEDQRGQGLNTASRRSYSFKLGTEISTVARNTGVVTPGGFEFTAIACTRNNRGRPPSGMFQLTWTSKKNGADRAPGSSGRVAMKNNAALCQTSRGMKTSFSREINGNGSVADH
jgi:hypothetical protein